MAEYEIVIEFENGEDTRDIDSRKSYIVEFAARKTGLSQRVLRREIEAYRTQVIKYDNLGFRIKVYYNNQ